MRTTAKLGLTSWDQPTDPYNYAQLAGNWQILDFHDHSPGRGVPVAAGGLAVGAVLSQSIAAQVIGSQHLTSTLAQSAEVNQTAQTVKGVVVNGGPGTRTNTAYGNLNDAADTVTVVLPTNGLIEVLFEATWQEATAGAARAALFVGANQAKSLGGTGGAGTVASQAAATNSSTANIATPLVSATYGLVSASGSTAGYTGDVTTGQIIGLGSAVSAAQEWNGTVNATTGGAAGPCYIFAAAGTYAVSVQYKSTAGTTVTVSNRKLWVRALSYA